MKEKTKNFIKNLVIERIQSMSAIRNPKDSKYDLTITASVFPVRVNQLNSSHKDFYSAFSNIASSRYEKNLKQVIFQGSYAKTGNTNIKTLRLKIKKSDWPEEWSFPESEIDRRLFLQNFRLTNLDVITDYDEGGKKYKDLFPPEPETPIEIVFEEEPTSNAPKEKSKKTDKENKQTNKEKIIEALDALDYLSEDARDEGELEFAAKISEIYRALAYDVIKSKKR